MTAITVATADLEAERASLLRRQFAEFPTPDISDLLNH